MPADAFLGLSKLKTIQVSNAKVGTLVKNVFNGQRNLKELSLHTNNITAIKRGTFDFGQALEKLGTIFILSTCHLKMLQNILIGFCQLRINPNILVLTISFSQTGVYKMLSFENH